MFKIFILIILITSSVAYAAPVTIPGLFSTGVDDQYSILPDGSTDFHYSMISSADNSFPGPAAKIVLSSGFPMGDRWYPNNERSKWIAPRVDAGKFNNAGTYIYRIQFDLNKFKFETAVIAGLWSSDNNGLDILINNKGTGYFTPIEAYYGMFPFKITNGFVEGINTIDFVVYNVNAPTGLRVEITGEAEPKEYVMN